MKILDYPAHLRPREKLVAKGQYGISDIELLAILLRSGYKNHSAKDIAIAILRKYALSELINLTIPELTKIKGVGNSQAVTLSAMFTLAQRLAVQQPPEIIARPADIFQLTTHIHHKKQEHLVALYLDARHVLIKQQTITVGTINSSLIHPREVFAPALEHRASGVVLVHNHPSGDTQPSEEDIIATQKMVEAGEILDVPLIDHVIVGPQVWSSLREEKLL
jgi:DNA repair protein RadC